MTYYIVLSLSAVISAIWFLRRARQADHPRLIAIDLALVVLISGFVGARLLHVIYEEPAYYFAHPIQIFQFWYGGFVYLGGFIGALLGGAFFCDWRKVPFWLWADLAAPPAALAYALGRIGCFFNGCCYGRHCDLPWAVYMDGDRRHPTQLYATLTESLTVVILLGLEKRLKAPGSLFGVWLILHGLGRMLMEYFRDDPRGPLLAGLSLSTWLSAVLISGGLTLLAARMVPRLQRP